jgi:cobyrinic acid a,c-diamide synthase
VVKSTSIPRIVIAALRGGAGKTFLTTGIVSALRNRGLSPAVFKKGPDYIDAGWLGLAAAGACYNLDTYLMDTEVVKRSFYTRAAGRPIAVVEGNRGLFDGVDVGGTYSTAQLAGLLNAPVLLIVDAAKVTRTAAAWVLGCLRMDPGIALRGVILNHVAGLRHDTILRQSIEAATAVPVIGSVPKHSGLHFPQRHLGLLPLQEHPLAHEFVRDAGTLVERCVDMEALIRIAGEAGDFDEYPPDAEDHEQKTGDEPALRIGVLQDSAFQFYYPENLEALGRASGSLVTLSALDSVELPDLDALYIGGGFPETHAERLADNRVFRDSLRKAIERGLPVYAECGGLMYLSTNLCIDEKRYPMVGVFPIDTVLERKPKGLGYIQVQVDRPNPFYPCGTRLGGHEFHYSSVAGLATTADACAFRVLRGHGMDGERDGFCRFNALGTYMHIHALGEPLWAAGILHRARQYHESRHSLVPGDRKLFAKTV